MDQLFNIVPYKVDQLVSEVETGALGLPELQRPFIWEDTKVRDLFDSMMRGYPIGYLMIWDCPELDKKKVIGVGEHNYPEPKSVIIDGQQRLTSLFAVLKGKKVYDKKRKEREIIISFNPLTCSFEVGYQATLKDKQWIYNISDAFTKPQYTFINQYISNLDDYKKSKGNVLTDDERNKIANNITALYNLQSYDLPVFRINAEADEEAVSNIFVRVNSGGVKLKQNDFILTLLSLYWPEGRNLIEDFAMQSFTPSTEATAYNTIIEVEPQDIIRVVMAYAFDRARLKYAYKLLRGADFEKKGAIDISLRNNRFDILKEKLVNVLDINVWHEFLKCVTNAGYQGKEQILSSTNIFYSYAFYLIAKYRYSASDNENFHITSKWIFYVNLVSLYSGSFESTMEGHLNALKDVNSISEYKNFIDKTINEDLTSDYFEITLPGSNGLAVSGKGNAAWNAYCASLNLLHTPVLFSKSNLLVSDLYRPGVDGKRKALEKHHLFPKAYLKEKGYSDSQINQMANYAYIDWKDNMDILDAAPSLYYPIVCEGMSEEKILKMETENALPHGWENMDYENFLIARRKLMAAKIKEGFNELNK